MIYEDIAHIVKLSGTVVFSLLFIATVIYAFWPKNREKFNEAAHRPLNEPDHPSVEDSRV